MTVPAEAPSGSPLRNSLWNLLFRTVTATDRPRTAWSAILRGSCLVFFKEPVDDLPLADNEACRQALKRLFFGATDHRVYDFFEFLLDDDRAGVKEVDRKLIRRSLNEVLEDEGAPVRLHRNRLVPLQDFGAIDALATAEETLSLFDMASARRHLETSQSYLARRPEPDTRAAVREAVVAVAAVVRSVEKEMRAGAGCPPEVALGTVAPISGRLGLPPELLTGFEAILSTAHAHSGLPGASPAGDPPGLDEAVFLVVFCSSLIRLLLSRHEAGRTGQG